MDDNVVVLSVALKSGTPQQVADYLNQEITTSLSSMILMAKYQKLEHPSHTNDFNH
ncbi:thioredoxin-like protein [Actinobacillus equuli]|nr:thioredoxin-like protein [Actinobacillus equuli]